MRVTAVLPGKVVADAGAIAALSVQISPPAVGGGGADFDVGNAPVSLLLWPSGFAYDNADAQARVRRRKCGDRG